MARGLEQPLQSYRPVAAFAVVLVLRRGTTQPCSHGGIFAAGKKFSTVVRLGVVCSWMKTFRRDWKPKNMFSIVTILPSKSSWRNLYHGYRSLGNPRCTRTSATYFDVPWQLVHTASSIKENKQTVEFMTNRKINLKMEDHKACSRFHGSRQGTQSYRSNAWNSRYKAHCWRWAPRFRCVCALWAIFCLAVMNAFRTRSRLVFVRVYFSRISLNWFWLQATAIQATQHASLYHLGRATCW